MTSGKSETSESCLEPDHSRPLTFATLEQDIKNFHNHYPAGGGSIRVDYETPMETRKRKLRTMSSTLALVAAGVVPPPPCERRTVTLYGGRRIEVDIYPGQDPLKRVQEECARYEGPQPPPDAGVHIEWTPGTFVE